MSSFDEQDPLTAEIAAMYASLIAEEEHEHETRMASIRMEHRSRGRGGRRRSVVSMGRRRSRGSSVGVVESFIASRGGGRMPRSWAVDGGAKTARGNSLGAETPTPRGPFGLEPPGLSNGAGSSWAVLPSGSVRTAGGGRRQRRNSSVATTQRRSHPASSRGSHRGFRSDVLSTAGQKSIATHTKKTESGKDYSSPTSSTASPLGVSMETKVEESGDGGGGMELGGGGVGEEREGVGGSRGMTEGGDTVRELGAEFGPDSRALQHLHEHGTGLSNVTHGSSASQAAAHYSAKSSVGGGTEATTTATHSSVSGSGGGRGGEDKLLEALAAGALAVEREGTMGKIGEPPTAPPQPPPPLHSSSVLSHSSTASAAAAHGAAVDAARREERTYAKQRPVELRGSGGWDGEEGGESGGVDGEESGRMEDKWAWKRRMEEEGGEVEKEGGEGEDLKIETVLVKHPKTGATVPVPAQMFRDPRDVSHTLQSASAVQLVKAHEKSEVARGVHPRIARLRVSGWIYGTYGPLVPKRPKRKKKKMRIKRTVPKLSKAELEAITVDPAQGWSPELARMAMKAPPTYRELLEFVAEKRVVAAGEKSRASLVARSSTHSLAVAAAAIEAERRRLEAGGSAEKKDEKKRRKKKRKKKRRHRKRRHSTSSSVSSTTSGSSSVSDSGSSESGEESTIISAAPPRQKGATWESTGQLSRRTSGSGRKTSESLSKLPTYGGDPTYFERRSSRGTSSYYRGQDRPVGTMSLARGRVADVVDTARTTQRREHERERDGNNALSLPPDRSERRSPGRTDQLGMVDDMASSPPNSHQHPPRSPSPPLDLSPSSPPNAPEDGRLSQLSFVDDGLRSEAGSPTHDDGGGGDEEDFHHHHHDHDDKGVEVAEGDEVEEGKVVDPLDKPPSSESIPSTTEGAKGEKRETEEEEEDEEKEKEPDDVASVVSDRNVGRLGGGERGAKGREGGDDVEEEEKGGRGEVARGEPRPSTGEGLSAAAAALAALADEEEEVDEAAEDALFQQEVAAGDIQRVAKGWLARQELRRRKKMVETAIRLQSIWKGYVDRKVTKERAFALKRLQKKLVPLARQRWARFTLKRFMKRVRFAMYLTPRKAAMRVQAGYRGHLARRERVALSAVRDKVRGIEGAGSKVPVASSTPTLEPRVMEWIRRRVSEIPHETLQTLVSLDPPPNPLDTVGVSLCVLLELGGSRWKDAKAAFGQSSFPRTLAVVKPDDVDPVSRHIAAHLLRSRPSDRLAVREAVRQSDPEFRESPEDRDATIALSAALSSANPHALSSTSLPPVPPTASPARAMLAMFDWVSAIVLWEHPAPAEEAMASGGGVGGVGEHRHSESVEAAATALVGSSGASEGDDTLEASIKGTHHHPELEGDSAIGTETAPAESRGDVEEEEKEAAAEAKAEEADAKAAAKAAEEAERDHDPTESLGPVPPPTLSTAPEDDMEPDPALVAMARVTPVSWKTALEETIQTSLPYAPVLPATMTAQSCRRTVLTAGCIMVGESPSAATAQTLFNPDTPPSSSESAVSKLSLLRANVPVRRRAAVTALLGSRRLLVVSERKAFDLGPALTALLRVMLALLATEDGPVRAAPLSRSARASALRFYEADAEVAGMTRTDSFTKKAARALFPSRETMAMLALRAFFRSSHARAQIRLRRWREAGVMDLLCDTPLGRARRGVLDLTKAQVTQFRKTKPVPRPFVIIAGALCVVLGAKPSWKYTKKILAEETFLEYVVELDPAKADPDALQVAREILNDEDGGGPAHLWEEVRSTNARAPIRFYQWLKEFLAQAGEEDDEDDGAGEGE